MNYETTVEFRARPDFRPTSDVEDKPTPAFYGGIVDGIGNRSDRRLRRMRAIFPGARFDRDKPSTAQYS